jgi:hypothetical protein
MQDKRSVSHITVDEGAAGPEYAGLLEDRPQVRRHVARNDQFGAAAQIGSTGRICSS